MYTSGTGVGVCVCARACARGGRGVTYSPFRGGSLFSVSITKCNTTTQEAVGGYGA